MTRPLRRNITKKQKMEEIIKCGQDPAYFITNYLKVSHPTKGFIPFKLFPVQKDCLQSFQEHKYVIVNKSRQLGLSTTSAAYSLWMALFQREKNILIIATKLEVAKNFIRKVRANLKSLPAWLIMPKIIGDSVKHLEFSNGSRITAVPTSQDAGRSEALSLLIVDECLGPKSKISIKNKLTGEIKRVNIESLYENQNYK
jgi:phage terminase large subunit-like protein